MLAFLKYHPFNAHLWAIPSGPPRTQRTLPLDVSASPLWYTGACLMTEPAQQHTTRMPRYKRAVKPLPHRLTHRDRQILEALRIHMFLTAPQLCRLLVGSESPLSYF